MNTIQSMSSSKILYWIILLLFFIVCLISGTLGYKHYFALHELDYDLSHAIYKTCQLFTFEGGDLDGSIPVELQIVRFVAPLVSLGALIVALWDFIRAQWHGWKISRLDDHVVIVGFGMKGLGITNEYLERNKQVLIIDNDPDNVNLYFLKSRRIHCLLGDGTDSNILSKARVHRASHVYLVSGEDHVNVETCMEVYELCKKKGKIKRTLQCILHLQQHEFINSMKDHPVVREMNNVVELKIFNVFENCARDFLGKHPLDFQTGISSQSKMKIQLFIFGFGKNGEALALETGMNGHYANGLKPKIIVVDRINQSRKEEFLQRYPTFQDYCEMHYIASEGDSPQLINFLLPYLKETDTINTFVVCFGNKTHNLMLSLQLERIVAGTTSQIFMRTNFDPKQLNNYRTDVRAYGLPQYTNAEEAIYGEKLDVMAEALHRDYLEERKKEPDFGSKEADKSWYQLGEVYRDSSRRAADHIPVKLRSIGCEIVPSSDLRPSFELAPWELEMLAQLEHRRWIAERQLTGWTYADIQKSDPVKKESPYILEWNQITEEIRDYNRASVKDISKVLEKVGKKAVRRT